MPAPLESRLRVKLEASRELSDLLKPLYRQEVRRGMGRLALYSDVYLAQSIVSSSAGLVEQREARIQEAEIVAYQHDHLARLAGHQLPLLAGASVRQSARAVSFHLRFGLSEPEAGHLGQHEALADVAAEGMVPAHLAIARDELESDIDTRRHTLARIAVFLEHKPIGAALPPSYYGEVVSGLYRRQG